MKEGSYVGDHSRDRSYSLFLRPESNLIAGLTMNNHYMQRTLELAQLGQYTCAPNPMVGCVIVRDSEVIGEGFHAKTGQAHAEINALAQAGERARGATVYVSLEPCCHQGRTGPCTEALIQAGVAAVHIACLDPNPKVAGQGARRLEQAGIHVSVGTLADEAEQLNRVFFHYMRTLLPFVIAKWAMSLDGKIATHTGDSRWITSDAARQHAHELRQRVGAVIVGSGTVLADDPQLTVRLPKTIRQPLRVVLDARGRSPITSRVFAELDTAPTIVFTTAQADTAWQQALEQCGVEVILQAADNIDVQQVLQTLAQREITSVLVEGGSQTHASFLAAQLVQEIYVYIAPKIIGGQQAPSPVAGKGIMHMVEAEAWEFTTLDTLAPDILLVAQRSKVCTAA